jgi:UDPglucose 6-dehydrogenase
MGVGMVGGSLLRFLEIERKISPIKYDPIKGFSDLKELNTVDIIFICVPTPYDETKGGFDYTYLDEAFNVLEGNKIIVIKSTILPGTTLDYQMKFPQHKILFNPEFLTEATADEDTRHPNRQIVGYTEQSKDVVQQVLDLLPRAPFEKIVKAEEAEMIKYYNNCFYTVKVTFANQMYDLCQKLGINYDVVKDCAKAEPMMGTNHFEIFHKGYRGYGGKCLPKDARSLIQIGDKSGTDLTLLKTAEKYNNDLVSKQDNCGI